VSRFFICKNYHPIPIVETRFHAQLTTSRDYVEHTTMYIDHAVGARMLLFIGLICRKKYFQFKSDYLDADFVTGTQLYKILRVFKNQE
jgi:hypothetical protein